MGVCEHILFLCLPFLWVSLNLSFSHTHTYTQPTHRHSLCLLLSSMERNLRDLINYILFCALLHPPAPSPNLEQGSPCSSLAPCFSPALSPFFSPATPILTFPSQPTQVAACTGAGEVGAGGLGPGPRGGGCRAQRRGRALCTVIAPVPLAAPPFHICHRFVGHAVARAEEAAVPGRRRGRPLTPPAVSDAGPCPQRWAAVRGLGLSLRLGPPYMPACGLAQLTVVSRLAKGQIPILPPLVLCWSFELLSLNVARPRRCIPKAGRVVQMSLPSVSHQPKSCLSITNGSQRSPWSCPWLPALYKSPRLVALAQAPPRTHPHMMLREHWGWPQPQGW